MTRELKKKNPRNKFKYESWDPITGFPISAELAWMTEPEFENHHLPSHRSPRPRFANPRKKKKC
jgi:hypothetical protein